MPDESDLTVNTTWFAREHHHRHKEHAELEIEIDFNVDGEDLTSLILNADAKALEIAQGREHYIWRLMVDEIGDGFTAEATMYAMVPRVLSEARRQEVLRRDE
jgi:hypothetical protein